jgi:hypothetical protein
MPKCQKFLWNQKLIIFIYFAIEQRQQDGPKADVEEEGDEQPKGHELNGRVGDVVARDWRAPGTTPALTIKFNLSVWEFM